MAKNPMAAQKSDFLLIMFTPYILYQKNLLGALEMGT